MDIKKIILTIAILFCSYLTYAIFPDTKTSGDVTWGRVGSFDKNSYVMINLETNEIQRLDKRIDDICENPTQSVKSVYIILTNEISRAKSSETNLLDSITNEVNRARFTENILSNNIENVRYGISTNIFNGIKLKDIILDTVYTLCISNEIMILKDE